MSSTKFVFFRANWKKQDGRPGLWLAETFSTFPLKPLNRIQRNLTGSKILRSSTKFVFIGPIRKTRWLCWPLIGWDIFDFSSETAEQNSTELDRNQGLNLLYQDCVFRTERKNNMAALANSSKSGTLFSGAWYVALWASCWWKLHFTIIATAGDIVVLKHCLKVKMIRNSQYLYLYFTDCGQVFNWMVQMSISSWWPCCPVMMKQICQWHVSDITLSKQCNVRCFLVALIH